MRTTFPGYYRPTDTEFDNLWDSALIAVDANVLLNLYGYSRATRNKLLKLFNNLRDRLWIPHQFASEFQRNRIKAIFDQVDAYKSVERQLNDVRDKHLTPKHRHPFITRRSMDALATIQEELKKGRLRHEKLLSDDSIFDAITELLTDRVGKAPSPEDLDRMYGEARQRYESRIPPGYADSAKPEPEKFGDYVGWRQILDHSISENRSLILVTDDLKDDWWLRYKDRTIGPRPELISEYATTCKRPFYMYSLEQFTRFTQRRFGRRLDTAVLEEIRRQSIVRLAELLAKPLLEGHIDVADDEAKKSEGNEKGSVEATADSTFVDVDSPKEHSE